MIQAILIIAALYLIVACIWDPIIPKRVINTIKYAWNWQEAFSQCPKCLSTNVTLIEERTTSFPNAFRPKGIFCNGCGRQTPDFVELDTRYGSRGKWLVRYNEGCV